MKVNTNIGQIRKSFGYSQDEVASKLGISRQTYIKIEKGEVAIDVCQLEKLANFFGIQVEQFYYERENLDKFKQMLIYIVNKFGVKGLPKTKLAELLYLSDFYHFYYNLESMSNMQYRCMDYGPLADSFLDLVDNMFENGELRIEPLSDGAQMVSLTKSTDTNNFNLLSKSEITEIDEICKAWKDAPTKEIVAFTHKQKPWMSCRPNEVIPYELILQEDPSHVY